MRRRSKARQWALQILYAWEIKGGELEQETVRFWERRQIRPESRTYAQTLLEGVAKHTREIDQRVARNATNWALGRLAVIDRNILRLGTYELLYRPEVPPRVAIDEAIELARRYGSVDSPRFVNGVLDSIYREIAHERAAPV